ncbi:hypothetical protein NIES22_15630 [Calothrix brevissima NIES-22]|nr:hypothetical protein NIES22_15630 [Calothrix brevissima NIES-22]
MYVTASGRNYHKLGLLTPEPFANQEHIEIQLQVLENTKCPRLSKTQRFFLLKLNKQISRR